MEKGSFLCGKALGICRARVEIGEGDGKVICTLYGMGHTGDILNENTAKVKSVIKNKLCA